MAKPVLLITRKLPESTEARASRDYAAILNPTDEGWSSKGEEIIRRARVIIAIAGMEGALASVVGGMAQAPVIAVPTSVGYGASFSGVTALLSMLSSCAAGVSVVNIDNGFGAGVLASKINALS